MHIIDIGWTSVCLSHAGIVSKRLNLSLNCLHCLVAPWFKFSEDQTFSKNSNGNTHNASSSGVGKSCNVRPTSPIARKRLKIDGYMLLCIWPALNPLSIHVTFTAIVPGVYPGEVKNVLKWRTFELMGWITGERLKVDGHMLRCVWQALNPLFIHVTFTAIVPGAYPGEAKMCLRLSLRSQMPSPAKRVKATTYRGDSPEVAKLWLQLSVYAADARSVCDS